MGVQKGQYAVYNDSESEGNSDHSNPRSEEEEEMEASYLKRDLDLGQTVQTIRGGNQLSQQEVMDDDDDDDRPDYMK